MKILGWTITLFGCGGIIGTLFARNSAKYKLDSIAELLGVSQGYKETVDLLFYASLIVLVFGIIILIVGYAKETPDDRRELNNNGISNLSRKFDSDNFPNPSGKTINDLYKRN
ncbi:MAG: hypothetical protein FWF65_08845 [Bacteroidetes bacterium]|nr:hypothetical protein [Bacteroidota bacterium]